MAAGVLDAEFLHAVESGADRHDDLHIFHCREDGIEVVDFHVEIRGAFSGFRGHGGRCVFFHAGVGLVHHFGSAFLKCHKTELVAVRDFDGFCKAETADPERNDGLDLLDEQDRGDAFDVHGHFLLR